jgi:16S rRNA (adenine1518-N6/adenine1519-N6)-dimethyltransferase
MVTARKRFGQHFLEAPWVTKLVDALRARPDDVFVEIGPGRGAITRPLASRVSRLLGIEVDRDLAAALEAEQIPTLTVVERDVLSVDMGSVIGEWLGEPPGPASPVRIVGNLPYNISSPILFRILAFASATRGVTDATLMLQKEVADRLLASPGSKEYGVLSILAGLHADMTRLLALPPGAFRPSPKVSSAVLRLAFRPPRVTLADEAIFTRMVRTMFTQRRKTLNNALKPFADGLGASAQAALSEASIDGRRRPETLQLVELARLADVFASADRPSVL